MQTTSRRAPIGNLWNSIQSWLFPVIDGDIPVSAILTSASLHEQPGRHCFGADECRAHLHLKTRF